MGSAFAPISYLPSMRLMHSAGLTRPRQVKEELVLRAGLGPFVL